LILVLVTHSLSYYQQTISHDRFSLFDLSASKPEQLIKFIKTNGISPDVGTLLELKEFYQLKFSAQIKNIATKYKIDKNHEASAYYLEHKYLFETYSQMGVGKNFQTKWGGVNINVEGFFEDYFRTFDYSRTVLALRYDLGLFFLLSAIETIFSGVIAFVIGNVGFYTTKSSVLKLGYSGVQTIGIINVGRGIYDVNSPSMEAELYHFLQLVIQKNTEMKLPMLLKRIVLVRMLKLKRLKQKLFKMPIVLMA
jgi:hypothetical protein